MSGVLSLVVRRRGTRGVGQGWFGALGTRSSDQFYRHLGWPKKRLLQLCLHPFFVVVLWQCFVKIC